MSSLAVNNKTSSWRYKILTSLSLALCLYSVALWARSYWHWDTVLHARPGGTYLYLDSHDGWITLAAKGNCPIYERAAWSSTSNLRTNLTLNAPETIVQPDGTRWTRFFIYAQRGEFRAWS